MICCVALPFVVSHYGGYLVEICELRRKALAAEGVDCTQKMMELQALQNRCPIPFWVQKWAIYCDRSDSNK
jgi:hypothetical protein